MNFLPLSEQEIQLSSLLPDGIYDYQVIKSEDKKSVRSGNEYISLVLRIYNIDGREHVVYTNLALIKLIKHFCDINGLQQDYESGNVPAEKCLYKASGKVVIGIEGEKPDGKGGNYKAKNIVKDYVVAEKGETIAEKNYSTVGSMVVNRPLDNFNDADIPF